MKNSNTISLETLKRRLNKEDSRYARLSKVLFIFYLLIIPVFLVTGILDFLKTQNVTTLLWSTSNAIAFLIFAILFKQYYKEYNFVDYSVSTLEMLKAAVNRYQPFQRKTIWAFVALVFIDLGMIAQLKAYWKLWQMQLMFIIVIVFAVLAGLLFWRMKYKPLRDNAQRMIDDIENG